MRSTRPAKPMRPGARTGVCLLLAFGLAACETTPPPPPPPPPPQSIVLLYQRPAERALINGMRQYEEGSFERAESLLRLALDKGLVDARDNATAHKYLAFITCAFNRLGECEQQFRDAFASNPRFGLSATEVGHPVWGPIYRKVVAQRTAAAAAAAAGAAPPAVQATKQ